MTLNQSIRTKTLKKKSRNKKLNGNPQKKGICISVYICKPKKPNSAMRKACKVGLSSGVIVNAYIPGERHTIQEHSVLMIRGGNVPDLPGINIKVIRGKYDALPVSNRKNSRSKYGVSRPKKL